MAHPRRWLLLSLVLLATLPAAADEPYLLAEQADGILELEGEDRLEVVGLHGTISLRQGRAGELRYAARTLDNQRDPKPVALWVDGRKLTLTAVEADTDPVLIEITLTPKMEVRLDLQDSTVKLTGIHADTRVVGKNLALTIRGIVGSLDLDVEGGTVDVQSVSESLTFEGTELEAEIHSVGGAVSIELSRSRLELFNIRDELHLVLDTCDLVANSVLGRVDLNLETGSAEIGSAEAGGRLRLSEAPLTLSSTKGAFEVQTDADVQFGVHEGPLRIEGFGSTVRGIEAGKGVLEIATSQAEVVLEKLTGSTKIEGDGLQIRIKDVKADVIVNAVASTIAVENAEKSLMLENEFGDVEVRDASELVQVTSRDGTVRILDLKGPAHVEADGPEVEVSWIKLPGFDTSVIENARGDVRVSLPASVRIIVDAEAPFGRIETDLSDLQVSEDGHNARGELRAGRGAAPHVRKPTVRLRSGADLYLHGTTPRKNGP